MNNKHSLIKNKIIPILLIIMAILCSVYFAYHYYTGWQQKKIAQEAIDDYVKPEPTETPAPATPNPTPAPTPTPEPEPTPKAIQPEFTALMEKYQNEEIVGYLKIEGTSIDYPVAQTIDNEFYLSHDITKKSSMPGWIYMDYENDVSKEDKNIILYGHNMNSDTMFHSLRNYRDEDYFQQHRYITFNTLYDNYTWEVFSFYKTDTQFYYIQVIFPTVEKFYELAQQMKAKSVYDTGVEVTSDDRVLTLSTCSNIEEDTRYVVNAKLVEIEPTPTASPPAE